MRLAVCSTAICTLIGCAADLEPGKHLLDNKELFHSLRLNHRAINISTTSPYDTVKLEARAYNVDGEEVQGLTNVTLLSQSNNVIVFPDGTVKGVKQTSTAGVSVIARATFNGITLEDTAKIVVTNIGSPPVFKTVNPGLNNNTDYVARLHLLDAEELSVQSNAVDSSNRPIPRLILSYKPRTSFGILFPSSWNSSFQPMLKGVYVVDIDGYVYGRKVSDSVTIRVVDHRVQVHVVFPDKGISRESYISVGGGVYWANHTDDSLDIEFEDASKAKQACCTMVGMLLAGDSGNIHPFQRDRSKPLRVVLHGWMPLPRVEPDIMQGRSFHVPGRYKYISRKNPNVWGTIIVSDPYSN